MIFAKLDVCFWRHPKFALAGPAACGYWAAALAYLRDQESEDGILAPHVLGMLLGLGEREARKHCERLVICALFSPKDDGGYELVGYAQKNETKEQIELRKAETASRVAKHRGNRLSNAACNTLQDVNVTERVPGSGSLSGSVSDLPERVPGEPGPTTAVTKPPPTPGDRLVSLADVIPPELAEAARMVGVQDVAGAWTKFCGHYDQRTIPLSGWWQKWCANERKRERSGRPPTPPDDRPTEAERGAKERADRRKAEAIAPKVEAALGAVGQWDRPVP
jgi:hypothetical protein